LVGSTGGNGSMRKLFVIVLILFVTIPINSLSQSTAPPLRLIQTILLPNVHGRIDHFNVDVKSQRLFIAALGNHTVEVVDLKSGKWVHSIPGLKKPQGVWHVDSLGKLFIADGDDGDVKVYRGSNLKLIASIKLDLGPDHEAYDPIRKLIYVGYGGEDAGKAYGELGIINAVTDKHIGDVRTDAHPSAIILTKSGRTIFTSIPKSQEVEVIDAETRRVISKWPTIAGDPVALALDQLHRRLFVGARTPPRLVVFDSKSHQLIASLPAAGLLDGLFFDSARRRIYASGGEGFADVCQEMDANHYREIAKVPTGPTARTSLFVPAFNRYYVAVPANDHRSAEIRVYETEP